MVTVVVTVDVNDVVRVDVTVVLGLEKAQLLMFPRDDSASTAFNR